MFSNRKVIHLTIISEYMYSLLTRQGQESVLEQSWSRGCSDAVRARRDFRKGDRIADYRGTPPLAAQPVAPLRESIFFAEKKHFLGEKERRVVNGSLH